MLEQLRKSGASIFIYLIFGLLIVIFVINFAPTAGTSGGGGCAGSSTSAITIDGTNTNQTAYKVAYSGNQFTGRQKVYMALELLIRREILAQAAEERGIRVTGDLVDEEIKQGYFFLGGGRNQINVWMDQIEGETFFNFGKLKGWVGSLNVSMNSYKDEQSRGLQATLMAELIEESVRVSREEAKKQWEFENNTVTYDAVEFNPTAYADAMLLTDADIARFISTHEAEVKKQYTDDERTYKGTQPALKLRSIFIAAKPEETPAPTDPGAGSGSAAGSGAGSAAAGSGAGSAAADPVATTPPDDKDATKPAGIPMAEAKAKLEAARTAIAAGKQKFADAAKQLSTDPTGKANGGEIGWRPIENAQLGNKAVNDAVKALKPGEMTPVITTDDGAYLVMAEDKREGDLSYDQVKAEIAKEMAKDVWSKEAAKRAALEAHKTALAGNAKNLDELFKREINTEQERRRMQQMIEEQMGKQGSVWYETKDVPAAWTAEDPIPAPVGGGGGSTTAPAGSAAPAGKAGSAAGSPAAGAGSGSAATPTTPAPATPPADAAPLAPSSDVLPAFAEMPKPGVMSYGPEARRRALPVIGENEEAINALFDVLTPGMLGKTVYEANGSYVLVQLKEKSAPKVEDFDKVAEAEINGLRQQRAGHALEQWLKAKCEALHKDGKIDVMGDLIRETDDQGKPLPTVYRPCMSFR